MGLRDILPQGLYALPSTLPVAQSSPSRNDTIFASPVVQVSSEQPSMRAGTFLASKAEAVTEKAPIKMYSREFYVACATGGALSCGLTHMAVTPIEHAFPLSSLRGCR